MREGGRRAFEELPLLAEHLRISGHGRVGSRGQSVDDTPTPCVVEAPDLEGFTVMDDRERTLVVLLSMHRCGSSLTASILQRLGMSLGPFELIGADAGNPYGHFEAIPFHRLNRQIQGLAYGFMDDLPGSPQIAARFSETRGEWDDAIHIPQELLDEGRGMIRELLDSGQVSGFRIPARF